MVSKQDMTHEHFAGKVMAANLLESIEKGHLNAVIFGIGSIRIGGANKVGRQRRSNFWRKIVEHIYIVGGVADIDTLRRSHRSATGYWGEPLR